MQLPQECYIYNWESPLGDIVLSSDGTNLTGLWFRGQDHFGSTIAADPLTADLPVFQDAVFWLESYFRGEQPAAGIPIRLIGTPFQQAVWNLLLEIPYGETTTYGAIAKRIEATLHRTTSARAVGSAVGRNPISILVPCHRVMGSDGSLTGYAAGTERKSALLKLEQSN